MGAHWQQEKERIGAIRSLNSQIEEARGEANVRSATATSQRAAELRYGRIDRTSAPDGGGERAHRRAPGRHEDAEGGGIREDIAEVVSMWTGIPVARLM